MKRFLCLFLISIMLVSCLGACGQATPGGTDTTAAPLTDSTTAAPQTTAPVTTEAVTEAPAPQIPIVVDGKTDYRIVRSKNADAETLNILIEIRNTMKKKLGVTPTLATDLDGGTEAAAARVDILFGETAHPESKQALEQLNGSNYIITFVGNKLVINATGAKALQDAADAFIDLIENQGSEGSFSLAENFCLTGSFNLKGTRLQKLPTYDGAIATDFCQLGNQDDLIIFADVNLDEHIAYCRKLEKEGYRLYTENNPEGNAFATYLSDKEIVTVQYYAYNDTARVIVGPLLGLPTLEKDNVYEKVTTPKLAQLGLETDSNHKNGMCYVFQLSDGSYIIIDGGFNRARDSQQLVDFMFKHAPNPREITIAAWIITHSDGDHWGAFRHFVKNFGSNTRIHVEQVIAAVSGGKVFPEGTAKHADTLALDVQSLSGDAKLVRAHIGQKFFLRDATVEMLYTIEAFAPNVHTINNVASIIFTLDIAGQRFFFPGDATNEGFDIMVKLFGKSIKSDFVQTAHHGYNTSSSGSSSAVMRGYTNAAPSVVLWPVGFEDYPDLSTNYFYNTHLINLSSVKEIIVAGNRDVIIELPYTWGTSGYETIIK